MVIGKVPTDVMKNMLKEIEMKLPIPKTTARVAGPLMIP